MVMEYPNEQYEPPPPIIQSAPDSHVMVSEELDHEPHKEEKKAKKGMSLGQAISASRTRSTGIGAVYQTGATTFEVISYTIFLIALSLLAFSTTSRDQYFYTQFLRGTFQDGLTDVGMDFTGIQQYEDVWKYMTEVFLPALFVDGNIGDAMTFDTAMEGNVLIGKPEIRLIKVTNTSCIVPHPFNREVKECFGKYSASNELNELLVVGDEFENITLTWSSAKKLDNLEYYGKLTTYAGSGYVMDLKNGELATLLDLFAQLKKNRLLDRGTRAVFMTFNLYQSYSDVFSMVRAVFELPSAGGVIPRLRIYDLDFRRYAHTWGTVTTICEAVIFGMICYFLFGEVVELARNRCSYISWWNMLELAIVATGIATFILGITRNNVVNDKMNQYYLSDFQMANFDKPVYWQVKFQESFAVLVFFCYIKVFKFLSMNSLMAQLTQTLMRCAIDIASFFVVFLVFFFAYSMFGYITFGTQIEDYNNFVTACIALLRTILGDFDYKKLELANSVFGPLYFVTYIIFVYFVLLNMFLAIITDSYMDVKEELAQARLGEKPSIREKLNGTINRWFRTRHDTDGLNLDPGNYEEWAREMKLLGYRDEEIKAKHAKFSMELDNKRSVARDDEEAGIVSAITADHPGLRQQIIETEQVNRRVDILEESIGEALLIFQAGIKGEKNAERIEMMTKEIQKREKQRGIRSPFGRPAGGLAEDAIPEEPIKTDTEKKDD